MKYDFLNDKEQSDLLVWHDSLDRNRGDRARLRRAESPEDILLTNAFFHFLEKVPDKFPDKLSEEKREKRLYVSAAVAGLLAHVKSNNTNHRFAQQLATPIDGKKAPMSELRFQQLQKSQTTDDFYRRIIRAIRLLGGNVNIISLANDIIHWHKEFEHQLDRHPSNRLAVRWATDYFTALKSD
jgi:CRISPR system Cascade subunit CasB